MSEDIAVSMIPTPKPRERGGDILTGTASGTTLTRALVP